MAITSAVLRILFLAILVVIVIMVFIMAIVWGASIWCKDLPTSLNNDFMNQYCNWARNIWTSP